MPAAPPAAGWRWWIRAQAFVSPWRWIAAATSWRLICGSYVSALEPFSGSLWGKEQDDHPLAAQWLEPGQTRLYEVEIRAHTGSTAINGLLDVKQSLSWDL